MIDYEELVSKSHQLFFIRIKRELHSFTYIRHRLRGNKLTTCLMFILNEFSSSIRDFPQVIRENPEFAFRRFPIVDTNNMNTLTYEVTSTKGEINV